MAIRGDALRRLRCPKSGPAPSPTRRRSGRPDACPPRRPAASAAGSGREARSPPARATRSTMRGAPEPRRHAAVAEIVFVTGLGFFSGIESECVKTGGWSPAATRRSCNHRIRSNGITSRHGFRSNRTCPALSWTLDGFAPCCSDGRAPGEGGFSLVPGVGSPSRRWFGISACALMTRWYRRAPAGRRQE